MNAHDPDVGIFFAVCNDVQYLGFVHAELAAGSEPQQHGNGFAPLLCGLVDQLQMQTAFYSQNVHTVIDGTLHILLGFVDTGENDFTQISADSFANGKLTGTAYFNSVKLFGQVFQQEGIGLDGKAKTDFFAKSSPHQLDAVAEQIEVENVTWCGNLQRLLRQGQFVHIIRPAAAGPDST